MKERKRGAHAHLKLEKLLAVVLRRRIFSGTRQTRRSRAAGRRLVRQTFEDAK